MRQSQLVRGAVAATFTFFMATSPSIRADLIILGDSLSDTGNAYALTSGAIPQSPPYYQGRFSNGPVWVELLADTLGLPVPSPYFEGSGGTNFAVGGATTWSGDPMASFGMNLQFQALQGAMLVDPALGDLSDDLVVVWGGANDFFADNAADPYDSVANLEAIVTDLLALGAVSLLLPNLPPLEETPEFSGLQAAADFSTDFNAAYQVVVSNLQDANAMVDLLYFDVYEALQGIIADPAGFGFSNVSEGALLAGASNPDEYLFWDGVHPTASGHAELARNAANLVSVPAPSVLLLMLPGVLLLVNSTNRRSKERNAVV